MSIRQFLQAQLSEKPSAIAIKDAVAELTYQQLDRRINQLANYLRKQGVKPEVLVGVYAERSIDLAIAILAVMQAGGAYVPLDPGYPQARLISILVETKLSLILTQEHLAKDVASTGIKTFLLDTQWDEIASESEYLEPVETSPDNLAYIMYTSGSTGKPQGVQITIAQIESYLQAIQKVANIQADDIYLHSASFSFSSSIRQLLLPLAQGAKVVISSKENNTNLHSLIDLIQAEQITIFDTVASVWNYLLIGLAEMEGDGLVQPIDSRLRLLTFSGGLLTVELLNRVRSRFVQQPQIINIYGQTETIGVCAYQIPDDFNPAGGYVPVGTAYPHNHLYILNEELAPIGTATTGELYVSGASLARGYLNNPQLNDRKFIPNPFTIDKHHQILYKTGDLARYLPDGNLEIVGRQDFQVKIRGMRVEIEEIETVLMEYPDLQQAAVIGKKDRSGEQIIVAYLVCKHWQHLSPAAIQIKIGDVRSFLKTKLTDYMMPSVFEVLDTLPLTPNNKLDRHRLPEPSRENLTVVPPRDELERQLVKIWEKILGQNNIGITDNFFELGGHSLLALQLFLEIERNWHKRLLLAVLFDSPTIAALANIIRQEEHISNWSPLVLIKSGKDRSPLFCIHPIGGNLFNYYNLSKKLDLDLPIYGLQARGLDGKQPAFDRIEDMANDFIQAIQTIQPHGPYFLLGYSFGGIIAFEMARQLATQGEDVGFLGLLDIRCPLVPEISAPFYQWLDLQLNRLRKMTREQQIKYFINKIIYRRKTDYRSEIVTTLCDLDMFTPELLNVLDRNIKARNKYQPQVYAGMAHLFWTEYHNSYIDRYPTLGWGDLIAGDLQLHHVPGDHSTLMKEPHVLVLAEKLKSALGNE
jgi:amino acid adenylation domain-containing protein